MTGYSIIKHKGKEILYVDYQGLKKEDVLQMMDDATDYALELNRPMLRLSNMTGVFGVKEVLEKAKVNGQKTNHLTIKRAAVGISGAKKLLFNAFNRFTGGDARAFSELELEEAKDWLVA